MHAPVARRRRPWCGPCVLVGSARGSPRTPQGCGWYLVAFAISISVKSVTNGSSRDDGRRRRFGTPPRSREPGLLPAQVSSTVIPRHSCGLEARGRGDCRGDSSDERNSTVGQASRSRSDAGRRVDSTRLIKRRVSPCVRDRHDSGFEVNIGCCTPLSGCAMCALVRACGAARCAGCAPAGRTPTSRRTSLCVPQVPVCARRKLTRPLSQGLCLTGGWSLGPLLGGPRPFSFGI